MEYEWNEGKREANRIKHGVDFAAAEQFDWRQRPPRGGSAQKLR